MEMCPVWPPCLPRSIHKLSAQNEVLYLASWSLILRSARKGASPRTSRSPSVTQCGKMTEAQLRLENSPGMPQSTPPMALAGRTGRPGNGDLVDHGIRRSNQPLPQEDDRL